MDDYSMHRCKPGRCDEFFCHLSEWCCPQPLSEYEHALAGIPAIGGWLLEESRTTSQVAARLFPSAASFSAYAQDSLLKEVGMALFDSGYAPQQAGQLDTVWC